MWAGLNMMSAEGRVERYSHQPSFRSVLHGTGLVMHGVGRIDARLETVGVWFKPGFDVIDDMAQHAHGQLVVPAQAADPGDHFRRGIVYYLYRGRVVGVLLCGCGEMLEQARDVLRRQDVIASPSEEAPNLILLAPRHWLRIMTSKAW